MALHLVCPHSRSWWWTPLGSKRPRSPSNRQTICLHQRTVYWNGLARLCGSRRCPGDIWKGSRVTSVNIKEWMFLSMSSGVVCDWYVQWFKQNINNSNNDFVLFVVRFVILHELLNGDKKLHLFTKVTMNHNRNEIKCRCICHLGNITESTPPKKRHLISRGNCWLRNIG